MYDLEILKVEMPNVDDMDGGSNSSESSDSEQHAPGSSRKKKSSKPRLSAVQKNTNHKDAENKRRTAIRDRFTELSHMVPGAEGQERSEQVMLQKTAIFLRRQLKELRMLERMADHRGIAIDAGQKLQDIDYGGSNFKQPYLEEYKQEKAKKAAKGIQTAKDEGEED